MAMGGRESIDAIGGTAGNPFGKSLTVANQAELVDATQSIVKAIYTLQQTLALMIAATQITSGTYTPTLSNTTNIAASTAAVCQYFRVGNSVTVSGKVNIDPTAAGGAVSLLGMSLPIASNIANDGECAGTFFTTSASVLQGGAVIGDAANDRASFSWQCADATARDYFFNFTYRVI